MRPDIQILSFRDECQRDFTLIKLCSWDGRHRCHFFFSTSSALTYLALALSLAAASPEYSRVNPFRYALKSSGPHPADHEKQGLDCRCDVAKCCCVLTACNTASASAEGERRCVRGRGSSTRRLEDKADDVTRPRGKREENTRMQPERQFDTPSLESQVGQARRH